MLALSWRSKQKAPSLEIYKNVMPTDYFSLHILQSQSETSGSQQGSAYVHLFQ
jgi:hypothetical protein